MFEDISTIIIIICKHCGLTENICTPLSVLHINIVAPFDDNITLFFPSFPSIAYTVGIGFTTDRDEKQVIYFTWPTFVK